MKTVRSMDSGYTIVETMIFLAISGGLFLVAMLLVNGQQRKIQFYTTVRDFDASLQSTINNVASGYYNSPGAISCQVDGLGNPDPQPQDPSNPLSIKQGQNEDCTFIGQYIYLAPTPGNFEFTTTSYAGLRLSGGVDVTNLVDARPTPMSSTTERYVLLDGVTASMKDIETSTAIDTIAITSSFSQLDGSGALISGSSRAEFHYYSGGPTGTEVFLTAESDGIQICLQDEARVGIIVLSKGTTSLTFGAKCP